MKRLKTPPWMIMAGLLAALSLAGAGLLLARFPAADLAGPACPDGVGRLACGTPVRVVRYTFEASTTGLAGATLATPPASIPVLLTWPTMYGPAPREGASPRRRAAGQAGDTLHLERVLAALEKNSTGDKPLVVPGGLVTLPSPFQEGRLLPGSAAAGASPAASHAAAGQPIPAEASAAEMAQPEPAGQVETARPASPCPAASPASFDLIPVEGPSADHADRDHGDLNLDLRGYSQVAEPAGLVDYNGPADPDAPQLAGLFEGRPAGMQAGYRINQWIWDAGECGQAGGCAGSPIADWPVTLLGLASQAGEAVYPPRRRAEIYGGGYIALVLYAAPTRLTLGYTRRDSVAAGYVVHLENLCVDPALLALYQAQNNAAGWRSSGRLPALRPGQALGTALGSEIRVAIRDNGNFLDPRSRKDWWQGQ